MRHQSIFATAGALAALLVTTSNAHAYNTGGHYRVTQEGLRAAGLSQEAIDRAQIANYQVDYITNKPSTTELLAAEIVGRRAAYFHFDDLMTAQDVKRNLAWLEATSQHLAHEAFVNNDPAQALDGLGIALHALQDLYSHSNFADKNWQAFAGQRVVTFDDLPEDLWMNPTLIDLYGTSPAGEKVGVFTGNAGSSDLYGTPTADALPWWPGHGEGWACVSSEVACGLNHDSAFRRDVLVSEQMAIRATQQWAEKIHAWVGDIFWARIRAYAGDDFVPSCLAKMQETASAAGQWGFPAEKSDWGFIDWAVFGDGCDHDWQDTTWSWVLNDAFNFAVPEHFTTGGVTYPPLSSPEFAIPTSPPFALTDYTGVFSVTWGTDTGLLSITTASGQVSATLTIGTTTHGLGPASLSGNELRFNAPKAVTGTLYLNAQTKSAVTGYLRDALIGVPKGVYGSELVARVPPRVPVNEL